MLQIVSQRTKVHGDLQVAEGERTSFDEVDEKPIQKVGYRQVDPYGFLAEHN